MNQRYEDLNESTYFRCADFSSIVTLVYFGCQIVGFENHSPSSQKLYALFEKSKELDDLLELCWKRKLQAEPLALLECVRLIKNRMNEHMRTGS